MGVIVAIDGPAGAGKSTIAREVAGVLGFRRVDTGALYRTVTLAALEASDDAPGEAWVRALPVRFEGARTFLGPRDVTDEIRSPEVTRSVSRYAAQAPVRAALLELQRRLGFEHPRGAVLEGRDIGTVVFPEADLKVFLTASAEERARRRCLELGSRAGSYDEILEAIQTRDRLDRERAVAPLRPAVDAIELDSTRMTLEEVRDRVVRLVHERTETRGG